jgi:streptogramin lyase
MNAPRQKLLPGVGAAEQSGHVSGLTFSRGWIIAVAVGALVAVGLCTSATAAPLGQIRELRPPCTGSFGGLPSITAGPDGNLWFTCGPEIGRVTPTGKATAFTLGWLNQAESERGLALGIATGPDGNLWFADPNGAIGRMTTSGQVTDFPKGLQPPSADNYSTPDDIVRGPDGNLWFTDPDVPAIGRITPSGVITEFTAGLIVGSSPTAIVAGPDGALWFTDRACSLSAPNCAIGRITPSGQITEFPLNPSITPGDIALGPNGNLWFLNITSGAAAIVRMTPSGQLTEFSAGLMPNHKSVLDAIAAGPDGNLWFADDGGPQAIGRITPSGVVTEFSKGLAPTSAAGLGILDITPGPDDEMWFIGKGGTIGSIGTGLGGGGTSGRRTKGHCEVPELKEIKLRRARHLLLRSGCAIGKIKRRKAAKQKRRRVIAQSLQAGRILPAGSRVNLTLGR